MYVWSVSSSPCVLSYTGGNSLVHTKQNKSLYFLILYLWIKLIIIIRIRSLSTQSLGIFIYGVHRRTEKWKIKVEMTTCLFEPLDCQDTSVARLMINTLELIQCIRRCKQLHHYYDGGGIPTIILIYLHSYLGSYTLYYLIDLYD